MRNLLKSGLLVERRQRLLVGGVAAVLFTAAAGLFTWSSWNSVVVRHEAQLQVQAVMGAQAVDTYLLMMERAFATLALQLQAEEPGARATPALAAFAARHPEFEAVTVQGLDGTLLASSAPLPQGVRLSVGTEPSFVLAMQALRNGAAMSVSRPFKGPLRKLWIAPLRYGVRDAQGRLLYSIAGGLSVERAHAFWKDVAMPEDAGMGLVRNEDLYVIARHPRVREMTNDRLYSRPAPGVIGDYLRGHPQQAAGSVRAVSAVTGVRTVVSFQRLAHYPVTFFVADTQRNLLPVWWRFAWPVYTLLLALFGGGLAILAWIAGRQREWRAERERRLDVLQAQAEKERQINARLDQLSREQLASNEQLQELAARLSGSNARLEETNAELEAFMYSVSHDLRAPIRAIDSYAALLGETLPAAPAGGAAAPADSAGEAAELVGRIRASARRMADLLGDLLDLSRYSTKALEQNPIDMRAEVDAVLAELGADAGQRIASARIEIGPLPACLGDRVLVRQIWLNLIANALKFSARRETPVIRIGHEEGTYFVADNGAGFDMAYGDKLFKLFSRLHDGRDFEGTGIGLAIVKRVTERMGGRISAQAAPGQGATFRFSLPR